MTFKKPPPLPTLLTILGLLILCSLGTWQLHRLTWKNDLQSELDKAFTKSMRQPLLSTQDLSQDFVFKRGRITGHYIPNKNFLVGPRTHDGTTGKHFYAAFELKDGGLIFVNRGWVPEDFAFMVEDNISPTTTLTGIAKQPVHRNIFTPPNNPEKNEWFHPDIEEMAASITPSEKLIPYIFILEKDDYKAPYPLKEAIQISLPNNHAQYAAFWFAMAGILSVIFVLRFVKR